MVVGLACAFGPGAKEDTGGTTWVPGDADSPPPAGPCPPHAGFGRLGTVRTWRTSAAYEAQNGVSATWTLTPIRFTPEGEVRLRYEGVWPGQGGESTLTFESDFRCDSEGAWQLATSQTNTWSGDGTTHHTDLTYVEPLLVMKHDLAPGDSWTTSHAYVSEHWSSTDPEPTVQEGEATLRYDVGGAAAVTVPAGTFEVLDLTSTTLGVESPPSTWETHGGVGMVRSPTAELIAVER